MNTLLYVALCVQLCLAGPCQVSDGVCQSAQEIQNYNDIHPQATETIRPISHAEFTASAVLTDTGTIDDAGKEPNQ